MDSPAAYQFWDQIVVSRTTLQNLDEPAAGQIAPQLPVAWPKRDITGPKSIVLDGPVIALLFAAYIAQDVADPMIVAPPNYFASGPKEHADRHRPPGPASSLASHHEAARHRIRAGKSIHLGAQSVAAGIARSCLAKRVPGSTSRRR